MHEIETLIDEASKIEDADTINKLHDLETKITKEIAFENVV